MHRSGTLKQTPGMTLKRRRFVRARGASYCRFADACVRRRSVVSRVSACRENGWTMSAVLRLANVAKSYGDVPALDGIEISLPANAYIALLGPSGSGKTTLLR